MQVRLVQLIARGTVAVLIRTRAVSVTYGRSIPLSCCTLMIWYRTSPGIVHALIRNSCTVIGLPPTSTVNARCFSS